MWVFLSEWGVKPWETNGGFVYHEDLEALWTFQIYTTEKENKTNSKNQDESAKQQAFDSLRQRRSR